MKTPYLYTKNIKNKILTDQMLAECIYSVNKRAKNFRDKAQEYRYANRSRRSWNFYYYDKFDNEGQARDKMNEYYKYKEDFLSLLEPICIHKQFIGYERERVYDYEPEYKLYKKTKEIVWENCYYDHERGREVVFFDYETDDKRHLYFLYYQLADYNFHSPIKNPYDYKDLEIIELEDFETYGEDITELLSTKFVKKVWNLIQYEDYDFIVGGKTKHMNALKPDQEPEKPEAKVDKTTLPATEAQIQYIEAICDALGMDMPQELNLKSAHSWLNKITKEYPDIKDILRKHKGQLRKKETKARNQKLFADFKNGKSKEELTEIYKLKMNTVNRIIRTCQKEEEVAQ